MLRQRSVNDMQSELEFTADGNNIHLQQDCHNKWETELIQHRWKTCAVASYTDLQLRADLKKLEL